jgi:hypothetical protein
MKKLFCALSIISVNLAYAEVDVDELSRAIKDSDIIEVINLVSSKNYNANKKSEYSSLADKIITDYENGNSTLKDVARTFIPIACFGLTLPLIGSIFFKAHIDESINRGLPNRKQGLLPESFSYLRNLSLASTGVICLYAGYQMLKGILRHDTKNTMRRAKSIKQALANEFSRA